AGLEFLTDHFALRLADVVLIANSSFSFTAALLNDRAMAFFRPDPATRGFVAFDPWAAPVLLDAPWLADGTAVGADERALLPVLIRDGDTVFDVGANRGEWTRAARDIHWNARRVVYHAFEPNPPAFETLALLAQTAAPGQILARRLALGRAAGSATFHVYDWDDRLSGFNARAGEAMFTERPPPRKIEVPVDTIDAYCAREGVPHIHLLKLDVEGAEFDALQGAEHMLSHARVDAIQFEYGGTWRDAGTRLRDAHAFLRERGYRVFRLAGPGNLDPVPTWNPAREDFRYANFLAIHDRMLSHFGLAEAKMPELAAIARRHGIAMRGVAHIGAHLGEEVAKYDQWGIERVLLVEANPDLAAQLRVKFAQAVHVTVAACCLADTEDVRTFHVNAFSQSSSLLPLKLHEQLYPFAHVAETRQLRTTTLDHLLDEHALDPGAFNVLNIDVQGAELLVLKGAERQLPLIDLINVEVNFAELYAGVPGIEAIDAHLTTRGFERVVLACPYDRTWGDAIYVNTSRPPEPAAPESPLGRKVTALWKSELGAARRGSFLAVDASPDDIAFLADLGWRGLCVTRDPTATPALQVRIADSLRTDMALIDHPQALADALSAFGLDPCLDLLVLGKTAVADDLATHLWNAALRPALIVVAEPLPTSAMPKGFVGIASDTPAMGYRRQTDAG
ncbi:MAG: FkbM family methyltransferase, partial [Burkholderiales bacterium]|nr:FkbM family methyltransferase [Burkholderiales bacterium]